MSKPSKILVFIPFFFVLLSACSSPPPKAESKFAGRLIVLLEGGELVEVTAGPNSTFTRAPLTNGVTEAVANPERTQLVYATNDGIALRNLANAEVKQLVKGVSYCLSWSPNGKRFSYKQRAESSVKLFVSDLDGKGKPISEERYDRATENKSPRASDVAGCAQWVAPDKLMFDRFGPSQKKGGDVKPNTTTVATVDGAVKLVDAEKKWSVEGICKTGNAILRTTEGQIVIAKNLENPKTVNPASGPCSHAPTAGSARHTHAPCRD